MGWCPKGYVHVVTPTCECGLIWRWGLCRYNLVKMGSLRWALIQQDGCPYNKRRRQTHRWSPRDDGQSLEGRGRQPRTCAAPRSWRGQEGPSPRPPEGARPCGTLTSDSGLQTWEGINSCSSPVCGAPYRPQDSRAAGRGSVGRPGKRRSAVLRERICAPHHGPVPPGQASSSLDIAGQVHGAPGDRGLSGMCTGV